MMRKVSAVTHLRQTFASQIIRPNLLIRQMANFLARGTDLISVTFHKNCNNSRIEPSKNKIVVLHFNLNYSDGLNGPMIFIRQLQCFNFKAHREHTHTSLQAGFVSSDHW